MRKGNRRQARKGRFCSDFSGTRAFLGGLKTEHKKKDKMLDGQPTFGNVAWSLQHTKAGSRIDLQT
jgi:hypothetical protein